MVVSGSINFHLQSWIVFLTVLQIILLLITPFAYPLSFNFSSFDPNDDDIEYQGDAFPSNNTIKLTMNRANNNYLNSSSGRATYSKPVQVWHKSDGTLINFTTKFSFFVKSKDKNSSGDGLVFFLAANRFMPSNSKGECLGIISCENKFNSSVNPFVAIELDDFKNDWDPSYDHVGININSIMSVATDTWQSEAMQANARVRYESDSKTLSVFLTYDDLPDSYFNNISHVVDLREYLPEWVFVGFSAATGYSFQIHTITSWSLDSSLEIVDNGKTTNLKPKKIWVTVVIVGVVLVSLGLVGLIIWFFCSRKQRFGVADQGNPILLDNGVRNMEEQTSSQGNNNNLSMNGRVSTMEQTIGNQRNNDELMNGNGSCLDGKFGKNKYGPKKFSLAELIEATDDFAREKMIGKGGFGIVYKGFLREENLNVAIKRFNERSEQGTKEYEAEVMVISQLKHTNLVELLGYYHDQEKEDFILVYEFMSNGSLHDHLFKDKENRPPLTWEKRYHISLDLARGLHYLHEGISNKYVVHRDIKSTNVLLDSSFKAMLGDFGLARFVDQGEDPLTTYIAGTGGYLAPECAIDHQKPSKESDVYSFGIVALEIGCGRKAIEHIQGGVKHLIIWVWELYGKRKILEAADKRLSNEFDQKQMERLLLVGLWCAHPYKLSRPSIERALHVLYSEEAGLPDLPPEMPDRTYSGPSLATISESSSAVTFLTPPTKFPIGT